MPAVKIKDNEPFDVALRRFKRACEKAGVLSEVRRRECYEKPTTLAHPPPCVLSLIIRHAIAQVPRRTAMMPTPAMWNVGGTRAMMQTWLQLPILQHLLV